MTLGDGLECLPAEAGDPCRRGDERVSRYAARGEVPSGQADAGCPRPSPVEYLKRLSMGSLRLDDTLAPGEFRLLTAAEEAQLQR